VMSKRRMGGGTGHPDLPSHQPAAPKPIILPLFALTQSDPSARRGSPDPAGQLTGGLPHRIGSNNSSSSASEILKGKQCVKDMSGLPIKRQTVASVLTSSLFYV
jgi:hypothetical protein